MKIISTLFIALFCAIAAFAQAPQSFSYQAIANNASGAPVVNGNVKVRISILDNTATGAVLYTETHAKTTNAQGLFNLNIGQGTVAAGTFSSINWGVNPKFVKVELDPAGGTNYTTVGTSQFQSVPYAMYAEKVNPANVTNSISAGSGTGKVILLYTNSNAYVYYPYCSNCSSNWETYSITGAVIGAVADTSSIALYTSTNAYIYHKYCSNCSSNWETHPIAGTVVGSKVLPDAIMIYTTTNAYIYHTYCSGCSSNWETYPITGTVLGATNNDEEIMLYTTTNAYIYHTYCSNCSSNWETHAISGTPISTMTVKPK